MYIEYNAYHLIFLYNIDPLYKNLKYTGKMNLKISVFINASTLTFLRFNFIQRFFIFKQNIFIQMKWIKKTR